MAGKNKLKKNIIILTAIAFAVSLAFYIPGLLSLFESRVFDLYSRLLNPPTASGRVVIVEVDQASLNALSAEGNNWPWPRQIYAPILGFLSEADAVFMDILYTEPSFYGQEDDLIFAEAIRKAGNVYLPFYLSRDAREIPPRTWAYIERFAVKGAGRVPLQYKSATPPMEELRGYVKGSGNVAMSPDSGGVYRSIPLLFSLDGAIVPNLTFSYFTVRGLARVSGTRVFMEGNEVPLRDGRVMLRYFRNKEPFQRFSAADILAASLGKGHSPQLTREYFRGKVVFLGLTAPGLFDLKPTPVSGASTGVHIHATLFDNLSNRTFMKPLGPAVMVPLIFVVVLVIVFFVLLHHSLIRNFILFGVTFCAIIGLTAFLFSHTYYLPVVYPVASLLISFIISATFKLAYEGKERLFIKKTFSRYMDKTLVDHVLKNPEIIKPGGTLSWVTVLFADIAGFTTISEKHSPQDTAMMLHTVFSRLSDVVVDEQGVIDKYIGDCIMAFWGAPLEGVSDETNACRAALRLIESIGEVNKVLGDRGVSPISLRVGLHSGNAIVGNMGSDRLFDYTVIGDTVNLASRLEAVNKVFGTKIIVSEKTLEKTGGLFLTRDLGPIEVKGKSEAVHIWELLSTRDRPVPGLEEKNALYETALALYREQHFQEAMEGFDLLLRKYPDDGPSLFYRRRCEGLSANFSLTKNWDVIKMTEK